MKLSPLDIHQKQFEKSFRGYATRAVDAFLELAASALEELVKENATLKDELRNLASRLESHLARERTLQETMITAQRISEDLKATSKKEAELVLVEAEQQAEKIVQGAHSKRVQVVGDIAELKRQRLQLESQLRSVIDAHGKLLDAFGAGTPAGCEPESIDDNVSFLAPKKAGSDKA